MSKPPLRAHPVDNETKQVPDASHPSTVVASAPTTHRYVFSRTMRHHQQQTDPQHVVLLRMIAASSPYASSSASGGGRAPLGPVRRTSRPSESSNASVMRSSSASCSSSFVTATASQSMNVVPDSSSPPLPAVVKTSSTMESGSNVGRKRSNSLQGPALSIVMDPPQQAHRTQAVPGTSHSANFETHTATVASSSSTAANSLPPYRNPLATNSARRRSSNDPRLVPPLPTNVTAVPSHSRRASLPMPKQTTSFPHSTTLRNNNNNNKSKSYRQKKSDPSEDYCCAICAQLFLDVVRIESCDHRFCATCLFHARVGNRCPLCRRMFTFGEVGRRTVALCSQGQSERERGSLRNDAVAGNSSGGGVVLDPMTMVMVKLYSTQKHHHEASSSIWQTLQHSTEEGDETERRGNRTAVVDELTARQCQLEQGITASVRGRDRWQRFWYAQLLQSYSTSQQRAMNAKLLAAPSPHDSFVLSISNMQLFWLCLHVAAYIVERYLPPTDDEPRSSSSSSPSEGEVLSEPLRAFLVEMIHVYDHLQDFGDGAAATTNRPQGGTRNPLVVSNTLQSFFLIGADQCRSDASDRRRSAVDLAYFDSLIDCSNEFLRQHKTAGLTTPQAPQEDSRVARSLWVRCATAWTDSAMHFFFLTSRPSASTTWRQKTCNEDATVLRACSQGVQRLLAALDLPLYEEGVPVEFLSEDTHHLDTEPVVHVWEWWADARRPPSTAAAVAGTPSSPRSTTASSVTSSSFSSNARLNLESVRSREMITNRGNTTSLSSSEPHTPCGVTLELHRLSTRTFPSPSVALSILQSGSVFSTHYPQEGTRTLEKVEEDDALTLEFIKQLATEWLFRHHMSSQQQQQQQGGGCTRGTTLPIKTALYDPETQLGHSKDTPSIVWVHQNGYMRRRQVNDPRRGEDDERTLPDVEGGRGGGEGDTVVISSDSSTNRFRPGQYPPPSLQDDDNGLMTLDDDEEHELDWIGGKDEGSHRRVASLAGPSLPPTRLPRLMSADSRHQADLRDAVKRASAQAHMMKLERR